MRILTRYILKQFVHPFLQALCAFVGILLIANIFEHLKTLLKNKVPFSITLKYLLYITPSVTVQMTPVAVLLGVIFCINQLNKNRELMIMKATGLKTSKIVAPLIHMAILISLGVLALNELLVPDSIQKANMLKVTEIEKTSIRAIYEHISFKYGNRFFYIKFYNSKTKSMQNVQMIEQRLDKTVSSRIDAATGIWMKHEDEYEWVLFNGIIRHFTPSGEVHNIEKFQELKIVLKYSPEDFKEINPEEMNISTLFNYISSLKESGYYAEDMLVDFYQKFSFPLASFFIGLVGIPFALRSKRSGMATGFGLSTIIAFIYWVSMSLGLAWGKSGVLPPRFAPFLPNLICLMLGIYLFQKTHT